MCCGGLDEDKGKQNWVGVVEKQLGGVYCDSGVSMMVLVVTGFVVQAK